MPDVTFLVYRPWTETFEDHEGRLLLHEERARLLHTLVEAVDVDVVDWGETDNAYPREVVEIIAALGSAGVFTALVQVFRSWIERNKMKDVCVRTRKGDEICIGRASSEDLDRIIRSLRLPKGSRKS